VRLSEVSDILRAKVHEGGGRLNDEVFMACGADLMSDVLAFSKEMALLLTGLVNPQVVRTAEMMDIKAIAFVRGKRPTAEILELARQTGVVIMTTEYPMYMACGILYANGLKGSDPFGEEA
jgi:hypothetical protein